MSESTRPIGPAVILAGTASWLAMMALNLGGMLLNELRHGHVSSRNLDEFFTAGIVGMAPAFAFAAALYAIAAVTTRRPGHTLMMRWLGYLLAVLVAAGGLWLITHQLWSKGRSWSEDLAAFTRDGWLAIGLFLFALTVGSVVFALVFSRVVGLRGGRALTV